MNKASGSFTLVAGRNAWSGTVAAPGSGLPGQGRADKAGPVPRVALAWVAQARVACLPKADPAALRSGLGRQRSRRNDQHGRNPGSGRARRQQRGRQRNGRRRRRRRKHGPGWTRRQQCGWQHARRRARRQQRGWHQGRGRNHFLCDPGRLSGHCLSLRRHPESRSMRLPDLRGAGRGRYHQGRLTRRALPGLPCAPSPCGPGQVIVTPTCGLPDLCIGGRRADRRRRLSPYRLSGRQVRAWYRTDHRPGAAAPSARTRTRAPTRRPMRRSSPA